MDPAKAKILDIHWIAARAITEPWFSTSNSISEDALAQIAELMQDIHSLPASISLFLSEVPSRERNQYVMPIELKELHKKLVEFLKTKRDLSEHTHKWMCIHGPIGNGKSEYVHYLKWLLGDKIDFVQLSVSSLRWSKNPSAELEKIYRDLEAKYRDSDKYVVVFMDEFDQLFSTELEFASKTSTNSRSNSNSSTQSTITEKTATTDTIGVSLYNSLKNLLSGWLSSHRIFTIATTNKTIEEVPESLRRGERLESVSVENPFQDVYRSRTNVRSLPKNRSGDTKSVPRYNNIPLYIHEIIDICIAIENRSSNISEENIALLQVLKKGCKKVKPSAILALTQGWAVREDHERRQEDRFVEAQQRALTKILAYLWYSGAESGFFIFTWDLKFGEKYSPDITNLTSINRAQIAELYKKNRQDLSEEGFKKEIARFLFPQLRDVD